MTKITKQQQTAAVDRMLKGLHAWDSAEQQGEDARLQAVDKVATGTPMEEEAAKSVANMAAAAYEKAAGRKPAPAARTYMKQGLIVGKDRWKACKTLGHTDAVFTACKAAHDSVRRREITWKALSVAAKNGVTPTKDALVAEFKGIAEQAKARKEAANKFDREKLVALVGELIEGCGKAGFACDVEALGQAIPEYAAAVAAAEAQAQKEAEAKAAKKAETKAKEQKAKADETAGDAEGSQDKLDKLAETLAALGQQVAAMQRK